MGLFLSLLLRSNLSVVSVALLCRFTEWMCTLLKQNALSFPLPGFDYTVEGYWKLLPAYIVILECILVFLSMTWAFMKLQKRNPQRSVKENG